MCLHVHFSALNESMARKHMINWHIKVIKINQIKNIQCKKHNGNPDSQSIPINYFEGRSKRMHSFRVQIKLAGQKLNFL